jgi:threonine dehydratase
MSRATTATDLRAVAARITGHVHHTPLLHVDSLPGIAFKAEHLQRGGSFKTRGAANALLTLGGTGIVTGSSGNHGIAVALLGRALGIDVTVVMAEGANAAKEAVIRSLGARIRHTAGGVAERDQRSREHARRTGGRVLPSSDHELVVAGQATVALEVLDDAPGTDVLYVPTGGGGLLAGACLAAEQHDRPVRVVGVEPLTGRRYALSVAADRPVRIPPPDTIADGLRAQHPGEVPFPIIRRRADDLVGVTDEEITHAMRLLHDAGIEAEPSGSVALAGALRCGFPGRAAVVVSGGNNHTRKATP